MPGLVDDFAANIEWNIRPCNVIVEGTTDANLLWWAAALYHQRYSATILGDGLSIVAAGKGDDGGVEGVNRRLNAARQIADADRGPDGSLRYRFIGLYDNDRAGRRAVNAACNFDRRLRRYCDLFLLHPVMPLASGADHVELGKRFERQNVDYDRLDWEIEDLLSNRLLTDFEEIRPNAIRDIHEQSGRKHREFTRDGKRELHKFIKDNAELDDLFEIVKLIRALRDYFLLKIDHIIL